MLGSRKVRRKNKINFNIYRNIWVVHLLVILCWIIWLGIKIIGKIGCQIQEGNQNRNHLKIELMRIRGVNKKNLKYLLMENLQIKIVKRRYCWRVELKVEIWVNRVLIKNWWRIWRRKLVVNWMNLWINIVRFRRNCKKQIIILLFSLLVKILMFLNWYLLSLREKVTKFLKTHQLYLKTRK